MMILKHEHGLAASSATADRGPGGEPSLREILAVLRRRSRLILASMVVLTGLVALAGASRAPSYTAAATLMVEPRGSKVVNFEAVVQRLSENAVSVDLLAASVQTHIHLIESDENIARALDRLGPAASAEDGEEAGDGGGLAAILDSMLPPAIAQHFPPRWLASAGGPAIDERAGVATESRRSRAIARLRDDLELKQAGRSYVLSVSYTAHDPRRAVLVANTVADAYVDSQLEQKFGATRRASDWLAQEVDKLGAQLGADERAVEDYRRDQGLARGPDNARLDAQQLAILTTELVNARADSTAKTARLQRVQELRARRSPPETLAEVLGTPLVATLREQEFGLLREEAQLSQEYGDRHPRILLLRAERGKLAQRMRLEVENALQGLENELEVAHSRVTAIEASIAEAKGQSALIGKAGIELTELERKADASRSLYENFLLRLKETEQQQGIVEPEVRVVSPAEEPSTPSSLPPMLFAAAGFVVSIAVAPLLAFLAEHLDGHVRHGRQLEQLLRVRDLGLVPAVPKRRWRRRHRPPHEQIVSKPYGAFAESVRSVLGRLERATEQRPHVVLVTSSLPGEGKTTLASSLAIAATQLEKHTLLIDLDLRRPRIAQEFGFQAKAGVAEVAMGTASLDEAVYTDPRTGVDLLAVAGLRANPLAILAPGRLEALLRDVRTRYDFVVLDTPPALGVQDANSIVDQADCVLFVIRWDHTRQEAARSALQRLEAGAPKLAGAVLNLVNMQCQARLAYGDEGQYFHKYSSIYSS
jgi:capsular exopolysaccharide synthesis family protein